MNQGPGCRCSSLGDLAVVPMGMDGLDERVFASIEIVRHHGGDQWWLYLSRCSACGQNWMVAQDERIFDDYFLRRMKAEEAQDISVHGRWPEEFLTYERVLSVGRSLSLGCRFADPLDPALIWTAKELREARPEITLDEIGYLPGVAPEAAARLLAG